MSSTEERKGFKLLRRVRQNLVIFNIIKE